VLAALVGVYVALRASPDAVRRAEPVTVVADPGRSVAPRTVGAGATPALPAGSGGVHMRDHRTDPGPAGHDAPVHAPGARTIEPQVTSDLARALRGALARCAAGLVEHPRVDGTITIAIRDHRATILEARFDPRDVPEAATAALTRCLRERALGVTTSAGEEGDLERYAITLSLILP